MSLLFEAELDFILPPKANRYLSRNGKRFLPLRIKNVIDDAVFILSKLRELQNLDTIETYVLLEVFIILPDKRRRDLDNIMKTLGDCLECANIIKDDNLIVKKIVEKAYSTRKEAKTIIKLYSYTPKVLD